MAHVRTCPECHAYNELMHVKDGYWVCRHCGHEEDEGDLGRGTRSGRIQGHKPNVANGPKTLICAICKAPLDPECLCPIHPNTL